jgi:aminopeptidase N
MLLRSVFFTFIILFIYGALECVAAETNGLKDPEPGVARDLARWRAAHYSNVRYALDVDLRPGAEALKGKLEIRVVLDREAASKTLTLDWRVAPAKDGTHLSRLSDIEINGRKIMTGDKTDSGSDTTRAFYLNEHLLMTPDLLKEGENVLRMAFESPISATGSAAITRYHDREDGAEYLYSLFVPSDASTAFPCFDQPDLKARWTLRASAPTAWKVVSNTSAQTVTSSGAWSFWQFAETQPISTYVFAFAAGEFAEFADEASPLATRVFVRKSKKERAQKELAEVFRLNREGVRFFERYFDRPFPFPKYDLVVIPEFPFRGMEHAGATFLREETILFPSDPTANDLWSRADVMLHEAAHQWFGDLVTMRWFDDLWLKEGFATFMASKAIESVMPQYDAWKVFYQRTKPLAYDTDATKGTTPIWQEIPNLSAAKSAYGNIVYRKAPSMLRQAEFYLGAAEFQRAVQLFLKEYAFKNAEWADLVRAFEYTSRQKLDRWAEAWVKRRGMADVRVEWSADERGLVERLTVRQRDVLGEGGTWPMGLKILLAYEGIDTKERAETLTVKLDGVTKETRVRQATGKRRPVFVFANYEDYGYGRFLLDDASRAYVVAHFDKIGDDFLRTLLWGSLWEGVREAELAPLDYLELGIKHLARERDEVVAQAILARMETAFNRYLSDAQRQTLAPRLEAMLYEQMLNAPTLGLRVTYFRAYRQMATTDSARYNLLLLYFNKLNIEGMTLRSRDRFDLVTAMLSVCNDTDEHCKTMLEVERQKDTTDDGRRYAFAAGAAIAGAQNKKKYFDAFMGDKNLAESWIEASVAPFNNIRHAQLTLPYLDAALRELPTLKRTRKIFFVNTWLAAFLGGQCSEGARDMVRQFLAREQSLDRDLRLKVLEAADGLERCVRIRAKYASETTLTPPHAP